MAPASPPAVTSDAAAAPQAGSAKRRIVVRVVLLLVTGVSLYFLAPSLLQIFSSWPQLKDVEPLWLGLAVLFEVASYVALWTVQRIALRTRSWFAVATSQLAGGAAGRVIPGGAAAAGAFQYGILVRSGIAPARVASGLTATFAATSATLLALPVVALLGAIGGTAAPRGLRQVAYVGAGAFVLVAAAAGAALTWDSPLRLVGRALRGAAGWVGKRERFEELPERLLLQRDGIKAAFAARPVLAVLASVGKWGFDYIALLCILASLDARPDPALVLLAYAAASLLSMIPITPGGLGFVEAGLAGLLGLAGVDVGVAAVATLAYRLVNFWLPLPAGGVAYWLARRRYGSGPVAASASITSAESSEAASSPS
jgi:uncharacterized membrane protein YbhN (UPF0104 family)